MSIPQTKICDSVSRILFFTDTTTAFMKDLPRVTVYPVRPMTCHVFLKSSVSITKYPSTVPGFCALNLTVNIVSSLWRRDPSVGVTVNAAGDSGVKAARKSAKPMYGFYAGKSNIAEAIRSSIFERVQFVRKKSLS